MIIAMIFNMSISFFHKISFRYFEFILMMKVILGLPLVFQFVTFPIFRIGFIFCPNQYFSGLFIWELSLPYFISLFKFCVKSDFHGFVKINEFYIILLSMIFMCIQYFKYLHRWDVVFEWHT
jgi:hypothetical protein